MDKVFDIEPGTTAFVIIVVGLIMWYVNNKSDNNDEFFN